MFLVGGRNVKGNVTGLAIFFFAGSSLAYAQEDPMDAGSSQEHHKPSLADWNALTDARIAVVKAALQLTPEQQKFWPTLEEAIRARSVPKL